MSESKPKSKPIPEADQTVEQYIAEELSKEEDGKPKYPGLTIEKIISDQEYEDVRTHPNFRAMLERSNAVDLLKMLDDKMGTADESESKPKEEEAKPAEPKPTPVPAAPVLDVPEPMDPTPEVDEVELSTSQPESVQAGFQPEYKRLNAKLTNKVNYDSVGPFLLAKEHGLEDLLSMPSGYDMRKKSDRAFMNFYHSFVTPGLIDPLATSSDGYENTANHNFMSGNPIQDLTLRKLEIDTAVVTQDAARDVLMDPIVFLPEYIGGLSDDGNSMTKDERAIPLSLYPFSDNPVLIRQIRINPYRLMFCLPKLRAHRFLFRDSDAFLAGNAFRALNPNIYASLRKETTENMDVINDLRIQVALFPLPDVDGNRYYQDCANEMSARLYSELSDRSMNRASSYFAHLGAPFKLLDVGMSRVSASTVSQFNRILSSDGTVFIKKLGALLSGGRKLRLTVDTQTAIADESPMLRPMAAMANLLLLDSTILSQDTVLALITAVLLPFFGLHDSVAYGNNDNARINRLGATNIARDILNNPNRNDAEIIAYARGLERSFSMIVGGIRGRRGGPGVINDICRTTIALIYEGIRRRYELLETGERVFDYARGQNDFTPLTPFYTDASIRDAVLLGTSPYYTDAHLPECNAMHNNLLQYAETLSKVQEIGNIMPIFRVAFGESRHVAHSNALVVRSQLQCAANEEDVLPFLRREEIPLQYVELPFLGALSYLIYGVTSSEETDMGSPFIQFKPRTSIPMPSIYGLYLYFEKAICNMVFAEFSVASMQYHLKKQERLVQLSLDILQKYFVTLDPKSKERVTELFANWARYLSNAMRPIHLERIPNELRNVNTNIMVPLRDELDVPYGRMLLGEKIRDINIPEIMDHAMNVSSRLIDEAFITDEPVGTVTYINHLMQRVAIYALRERPVDFIDLDTLLRETQFVYDTKLSVSTIRHLMRQRGFRTVRVSDMRTTVSYNEQSGYTDTIIQTGEVNIERRLEQDEFKYAMSEIPVYYKLQTNELAVDEDGIKGPGTLNETFSTHVGVTYDALEQYMINFDGVLPSDPKLMEYDTNLRLKDGKGFVHSVPINVAHRDSESVTFKNSLELRKNF